MEAVVPTDKPELALSAARMAAVASGADGPAEPFVRQVVQLALRALPPMFLAERAVFCFKSVPSGTHLAYEGVSRRYTAMVLIGAGRLQPALSRPLLGPKRGSIR